MEAVDERPLCVMKTCPEARVPARASAGAAGYDLASVVDAEVPPRGRLGVRLGLKFILPPGHYGRLAPRSGLALSGVDVVAGVIDVDFKGEVVVILANTTDSVFKVKTGDRIAQLILEKCSTPAVILVEDVGDSARGEAGFGSTGLASC